jgi:hypothetical protein
MTFQDIHKCFGEDKNWCIWPNLVKRGSIIDLKLEIQIHFFHEINNRAFHRKLENHENIFAHSPKDIFKPLKFQVHMARSINAQRLVNSSQHVAEHSFEIKGTHLVTSKRCLGFLKFLHLYRVWVTYIENTIVLLKTETFHLGIILKVYLMHKSFKDIMYF